MKNNILKSLLAGLLIGIGAYAYITSCIAGFKVMGCVLFSLGLISVFLLEANLFTGKIGFAEPTLECVKRLLIIIVFNFVGIGLVGLIASLNPDINKFCASLVTSKLNKEWYRTLLDAIMCGVIIHLAVLLYRKSKSMLVVILAICAFIISGFEHCVANVFYFVSGYQAVTPMIFAYFALYIAGNSIGSILLNLLVNEIEKAK